MVHRPARFIVGLRGVTVRDWIAYRRTVVLSLSDSAKRTFANWSRCVLDRGWPCWSMVRSPSDREGVETTGPSVMRSCGSAPYDNRDAIRIMNSLRANPAHVPVLPTRTVSATPTPRREMRPSVTSAAPTGEQCLTTSDADVLDDRRDVLVASGGLDARLDDCKLHARSVDDRCARQLGRNRERPVCTAVPSDDPQRTASLWKRARVFCDGRYVCLCLWPLSLLQAGRARGQDTSSQTLGCVAVDLRDTTNIVRKEIDTQYGKIGEAIRRKDIDRLIALYTPDFHAVSATGEVWSHERALAYQRNGLAQVQRTHHVSNTIVGLTVCGARARATVLQVWDRTQMMAGKARRVRTHATQDEEWIKTQGVWKRGTIDHVRNGPAFVDDKRVDTNRPYDPDAPEYDPYDPSPRLPAADTLLQIVIGRGVGQALESLRRLSESGRYYVTEFQLNQLGYRLLELKRLADAIAVFKHNTEAYPQSANAYDSLGEAYAMVGERKLAIESYSRSLQLNPANTNAADMLRKLRTP